MILLLYPVSLLAAACWGVAAHRRRICRDDQNDYDRHRPPAHQWTRALHRHRDQEKRAMRTARALTRTLAGHTR